MCFGFNRYSLFCFFHICKERCLGCDGGVISWLIIEIVLSIVSLDDMRVEVALRMHVHGLDLRLQSQLARFLALLVGGHCRLVVGHRVQHRGPLRHLRRSHVVLLHLLVQRHHVLLALARVGLPARHRRHH